MRKRISKYKHLHSNRFRYLSSSIPLICASGLLLVCGMMISPVNNISKKAHAVSVVTGGATTGGSGDDSGGDDTTTPSIVMGIDNSDTTLIGQVNSTSTPGSITRNMTITASNVDRYAVYIQSNDDNNGQLVGQASGGRVGQITSTDGVVLSSIPDNTWGYALAEGENLAADNANLKYKAVSSSADATNPAYSTTTPEGTKKFTLAFGVKFADSANPDHYKADVLVSVAANPGEVTETLGLGFGGVTTMQEMTSDICKNNAKIGDEGILEDTRVNNDGKTRSYWVAKLKDGNCWMTQNLDYDGGGNRKETIAQWTHASTHPTASYFDPGEYIRINNADGSDSCNTIKNALSECSGWTKMENITAIPESTNPSWTQTFDPRFLNATEYIGTDGKTLCTKQAGQYFGDASGDTTQCRIYYNIGVKAYKQYIKHFASGNYYNYSAGTQVCPSPWTLPVGNSTTNGSFYYLLAQYGLNSKPSAGSNAIYRAPLYFVYGGEIWDEQMSGVNSQMYYTTPSSTGDGYTVYSLMAQGDTVDANSKGVGFRMGISTRCMLKS